MAQTLTEQEARRNRELMLRVAREPEYCCGCFRLSPADRRRARRVFRISHRVTRAGDKERADTGRRTEAGNP